MIRSNKILLVVFTLLIMFGIVQPVNAATASFSVTNISNKTPKSGETVSFNLNVQASELAHFRFTFSPTIVTCNVNGTDTKEPVFQSVTSSSAKCTFVFNDTFTLSIRPDEDTAYISSDDSIVKLSNKSETFTKFVETTPEPSKNANLKSLGVSPGTLKPAFSSSTIAYTVDLPSGTKTVNVTGSKDHDKATVEGIRSGVSVSDGLKHNIVVTAEDGTKKTYTITFSIPKPEPEPETPEPSDKTEKVIESIDFDTEYRDDPNLEVGKERVVRAGVKGQVEITYKVSDQSIVNRRIIKQPMAEIIARGTKVVSVSTNLKSLFVDGADISPAFSQTVTKYTFTLREPADTVTVRAEAEATGATVSGTGLVTLTKPSHVQKIVVSRDGQQTTYEVTINQPEDAPVETPSAEIDFDGKTIKVIPIEETILGFEAQTMTLQGQEVPVLSNGKGITVIELEGEGLFLVNSSGTIYSRFNPVLINGTRYFALDIPEEGRDMEQLVYSEFKLGEYTIYGFQYVDETRANYKIFYLQNEEGSIDEYLYNVDDESLVLLKEASFETPVETETIDETTASERLDMQDLVVYAGLIVLGILTIVLLLLVIRRIRERS